MKGTAVKLSIITVCRNEAARIAATAESVVRQASSDFEWIVLDGGSTDGTQAILDPYRSRMAYWASRKDGGIYAAMNEAVRHARGEYLHFLNGGDSLASETVVRDAAAHARGDLVVGNILIRYPDENREQLRDHGAVGPDADYLYWRCFHHQSTWFRRDLFERYGGYDLTFRIAADWEFMCRTVLRHGATVQRLPVLMAVFHNDGQSARLRRSHQADSERRAIRRRYYPLGYRLRRDANEWWGRLQHRLRRVPAQGAGPGAEA